MLEVGRRFWDPLYGRVEVDAFEARLLMSPEVQRLRYVRMCNINSLLITGASEITRFEHSIGVLRLAQEWLRTHSVSHAEGRNLRAAAILHDFQTPPYGHSLQYILENQADSKLVFKHEDLEEGRRNLFFQKFDAGASFAGRPFRLHEELADEWPEIVRLISGSSHLGQLISSEVDLDNIDNVIRLAYHSGLADGSDAECALRLARSIQSENGLVVTRSALPDLQTWLSIRERLYRFLLEDPGEFSAKAMLTRAIEDGLSREILGADSWLLTDDELLGQLRVRGVGEAQAVRELVERLIVGDLYSPVCLLETSNTDLYAHYSSDSRKREQEDQLRNQFLKREALESGHTIPAQTQSIGAHLLIHPILDVGKTSRQINFRLEGSTDPLSFGGHSRRLLLGLFTSSPLSERRKEMLTQEFLRQLELQGATEVVLLSDPMGQGRVENRQMELI